MKKNRFWSFKRARKFVRKLGLKSQGEWEKYCSDKISKPVEIPATPYIIYKNIGWSGWKDWLNHNRMIGGVRKYTLNESFFKKWSYDMAYIFGFWFADGYIDVKRNSFSIYQHKNDQHKNDQYLLNEILRKMGSNISSHCYTDNCSVLTINSKKIVSDIVSLGGKPCKSLDCVFPSIPNNYLPDFLRGLWDGDGCISNQKWRGYNYYRASLSSGSKQFIFEVKSVINKNIPMTKGFIETKTQKQGTLVKGKPLNQDSVVYQLNLGINDTRRLRDYIYQHDGLKMDRKYQKFVNAGAIKFKKPVTTVNYDEAIKYSLSLKLKTKNEWFQYFKTYDKPKNIPINPYQRYKNDGWIDWSHWLGKERKTARI